MYESSTLCMNWLVHQANTAGAFVVHQANAAGAFIVHQGNVVEHFGSYIKAERSSPTVIMGQTSLYPFCSQGQAALGQTDLQPVTPTPGTSVVTICRWTTIRHRTVAQRQGPGRTVVIGTSLIKGVGQRLSKFGVEQATTYMYRDCNGTRSAEPHKTYPEPQ